MPQKGHFLGVWDMKLNDLLEKLQKVKEEHGEQVDVEFTFTEIKNDNKTHW